MRKKILSVLLIVIILIANLLVFATPAFAMTSFIVSASDGWLQYSDVTYNTAWVATSSGAVTDTDITSTVGQNAIYNIRRAYLYFDTSSIPDGVTITAATLKLYGSSNFSVTDFDITIQNGQPTYPHDPLINTDYNKSLYSSSGGTLNTSGFTTSGYNSITLDATGISWINKTGTTKFCLRSSRDIAGTTPAGNEYVNFYTYEKGVGYYPKLEVTWTVTAPAITAVAASNVAQTTARLNSTITDDGSDASVQVRFGYGLVSHIAADFESYTTKTAWVDGYHIYDNPYYDASSLSGTYYYRVQVKNTNSTVTSTDEITFTTIGSIGDVTNFYGYPSATSISLSWIPGSGDSRVLVRYRTDIYPTSETDGTQIYLGSATTYEHTGLTSGITYYYSAWGESAGSYSTNEINLAMTTTVSGATTPTFPTPEQPDTWYQEPDESLLTNLAPLNTIVNTFIDDWQVPRATGWIGFTLLGIMAVGIFLYIKAKAPGLALFTMMLLMIGTILIHLLPTWFVFIVIIMGIGVFSLQREAT